jgi:thymidylate synthase
MSELIDVPPDLLPPTATEAWRELLRDLLEDPAARPVAPTSRGANWRGSANRELIGYRTRVPMTNPVVLCPGRRLGYRFMAAEAAWILSGDNRLETIAPFAPRLKGLSDDGRTLAGAYGPPLVDQLPYVTRALRDDPSSRQAVVSIWRPRPSPGAGDVPCTLALQWLIRPRVDDPSVNELHAIAFMRSSDAWLGLPYDWFAFSMASAYLALILRRVAAVDVSLGELTVVVGSQHLYRVDHVPARACLDREDVVRDLPPLDLGDFAHEDELVTHLWSVARREGVTYGSWLDGLVA